MVPRCPWSNHPVGSNSKETLLMPTVFLLNYTFPTENISGLKTCQGPRRKEWMIFQPPFYFSGTCFRYNWENTGISSFRSSHLLINLSTSIASGICSDLARSRWNSRYLTIWGAHLQLRNTCIPSVALLDIPGCLGICHNSILKKTPQVTAQKISSYKMLLM